MRRRLSILAGAALMAGAGALPAALGARAQTGPVPTTVPTTVTVQVGDAMVVKDGAIGCQVVERSGRPMIDCRRAGHLRGTYATLLTARRAEIARFRSDHAAKVIFTARHHGGAHRCGGTAR
jgi:hypothetical protein